MALVRAGTFNPIACLRSAFNADKLVEFLEALIKDVGKKVFFDSQQDRKSVV